MVLLCSSSTGITSMSCCCICLVLTSRCVRTFNFAPLTWYHELWLTAIEVSNTTFSRNPRWGALQWPPLGTLFQIKTLFKVRTSFITKSLGPLIRLRFYLAQWGHFEDVINEVRGNNVQFLTETCHCASF